MDTVEMLIRLSKDTLDAVRFLQGSVDDHHIINGYQMGSNSTVGSMIRAIANGTVLPKGHGDLKDMNDLCYKSRYGCKGNCDYLHICNSYSAPTIIEANKDGE